MPSGSTKEIVDAFDVQFVTRLPCEEIRHVAEVSNSLA
jgi:hypothetical protein